MSCLSASILSYLCPGYDRITLYSLAWYFTKTCGVSSPDLWLPVRSEPTWQPPGEGDSLYRDAASVGNAPDCASAQHPARARVPQGEITRSHYFHSSPYLCVGYLSGLKKGTALNMCTVQFRKAHLGSTLSLTRFPNIASEAVPVFIWFMMALSHPLKEDHQMLPLSTPENVCVFCIVWLK